MLCSYPNDCVPTTSAQNQTARRRTPTPFWLSRDIFTGLLVVIVNANQNVSKIFNEFVVSWYLLIYKKLGCWSPSVISWFIISWFYCTKLFHANSQKQINLASEKPRTRKHVLSSHILNRSLWIRHLSTIQAILELIWPAFNLASSVLP